MVKMARSVFVGASYGNAAHGNGDVAQGEVGAVLFCGAAQGDAAPDGDAQGVGGAAFEMLLTVLRSGRR